MNRPFRFLERPDGNEETQSHRVQGWCVDLDRIRLDCFRDQRLHDFSEGACALALIKTAFANGTSGAHNHFGVVVNRHADS